MSLFQVGRLCVKLAGRDAGRKCVVVEQLDDKLVIADGDVRRKRVNVKHLEPLGQTLEIKEKASHEDVAAAFQKLSLPVWGTKKKEAGPKPIKQRQKKEVKDEAAKEAKAKEKKVKKE
ncbi:50S ribosomal protein L14e [Candidatus Woesearchaeota archaeon]|nr:50S ribosomal protein L14e [Candidatus Woesearchaeota archaeon]